MIPSRAAWPLGVALIVCCGIATAAGERKEAAPGRSLFLDYCASCHGTDGKGHGPVAPSLRNAPADLTQLTHRHAGKYPRPDVILVVDGRDLILAHGTRDMPIWGQELKRNTLSYGEQKVNARVEAIVDYLETIQAP
jgi:mono/diheme cytochrome c family protein